MEKFISGLIVPIGWIVIGVYVMFFKKEVSAFDYFCVWLPFLIGTLVWM